MAVKALIFGTDDLYPKLKPLYEAEVKKGNLEIVGYADFNETGELNIYEIEMINGRGVCKNYTPVY